MTGRILFFVESGLSFLRYTRFCHLPMGINVIAVLRSCQALCAVSTGRTIHLKSSLLHDLAGKKGKCYDKIQDARLKTKEAAMKAGRESFGLGLYFCLVGKWRDGYGSGLSE